MPRSDRVKGGRPPFDHVLMFKTLILQASHNLSDERTEYLIRDRLSFMRFLGLGLADTVPDANTIWTFREALARARIAARPAIEVLFERFDAALPAAGFLAMSGQIIDASIVAAPKQRNTDGEKRDITAPYRPSWSIRTTPPATSGPTPPIALRPTRNSSPTVCCARRSKGKPMPHRTARANARNSAVRSALEHVFARQKVPMGLFIRTTGMARARTKIGLANLLYNVQRVIWLTAQAAPTSPKDPLTKPAAPRHTERPNQPATHVRMPSPFRPGAPVIGGLQLVSPTLIPCPAASAPRILRGQIRC